MAYDKNEYNKQYKKDNFDNMGFYAPKGTKEKVSKIALAQGKTYSEYMRDLISAAIEQDTHK